jgi:hypothetical protein
VKAFFDSASIAILSITTTVGQNSRNNASQLKQKKEASAIIKVTCDSIDKAVAAYNRLSGTFFLNSEQFVILEFSKES